MFSDFVIRISFVIRHSSFVIPHLPLSSPSFTLSQVSNNRNLATDLVLPTLLFAVLGGMTWAVRGCSGFGALNGCVFAGVTWGAAWWFIARDPGGRQSRRYASGWIILALTVGIGLSGARGWMQWPSFFNGHLQTDTPAGKWVPIPRIYGFIWLFIAGMPWAGIGACLLAWCGSKRPTRAWQWALRLACGFGASYLALFLFNHFPEYFMPLYKSLKTQYLDFQSNPNLRRLTNDNRAAVRHLGFYLGFLLFEVGRRDWKNVMLILTVGIVNGLGWALCQNWQWATRLWPEGHFNFWRCWESSGGISIGIAYGLAYYLVNRRMSDDELARVPQVFLSSPGGEGRGEEAHYLEWLAVYLMLLLALGLFFVPALHGWWGVVYFSLAAAFGIAYYVRNRGQAPGGGEANLPPREDPNLERLGAYLGLLLGLGMSIRNGLKGWFNIYVGNERYWDRILWQIAGPLMLLALLAILVKILWRSLPRPRSAGVQTVSSPGVSAGDPFPHAYGLIWLVLIVQNIIAQLVTGPLSSWQEVAFSIYYVLLFFISAIIIYHFNSIKQKTAMPRRSFTGQN